MCGRYGSEISPEQLSLLLDVPEEQSAQVIARYNIAPTQEAPVARFAASGSRELCMLRWGLVPSWSRDATRAARLINARSETVAEKPSYRDAYRARRCLVPADGFYEWRRSGRARLPIHFQRTGGLPFAFAGLWERWSSPVDGAELQTFTVLTTTANELVGEVHDRMPVILTEGALDRWMDPRSSERELAGLLRPYPASQMERWEVSIRVNAVGNDDPLCRARQPLLL